MKDQVKDAAELVSATAKTLVFHRIVIAVVVLLSVNSLALTILGCLAGVKWAEADMQTKFMIVVSVIGNWTGILLAIFRQALAKIIAGKSPIEDLESRTPFSPTSNQ